MDIRDMQNNAHATACAKNWWLRENLADPNCIAAKLALIHSEVSEALECVRNDDLSPRHDALTGKPEGLPSELADIVIRVADLCGALNIDLDAAVKEKMAFNTTRTHRHGGRAL